MRTRIFRAGASLNSILNSSLLRSKGLKGFKGFKGTKGTKGFKGIKGTKGTSLFDFLNYNKELRYFQVFYDGKITRAPLARAVLPRVPKQVELR